MARAVKGLCSEPEGPGSSHETGDTDHLPSSALDKLLMPRDVSLFTKQYKLVLACYIAGWG